MSAPTLSVTVQQLMPAGVPVSRWRDIRVNGLTVDSRAVQPGNCFLAYPGHALDGRRFIADALAKGAAAVLAEAEGLLHVENDTPVIPVAGLKQHMGDIASRFYGNPSAHLQLVAVTGTNGKTTVTHLIAQAAQFVLGKAGVIGTLGNGLVGQLAPTSNTTPDIIAINAVLRELLDAGVKVVAMEASSHGLVQGRLDGLTLHCGIITNLSRDHLDYHGSMEAYRDAKAMLASHETLQHLILNADDDAVAGMAKVAPAGAVITLFSLVPDSDAAIRAQSIRFGMQGLSMDVVAHGERATIDSKLIGEFNAANLLAALAGLLALKVDLVTACAVLGRCEAVAGRMEIVNATAAQDEPVIVVDFAHTPDALEKVLSALRRHCPGQLWCVFGCGGDRDAGKRPLMGKAAVACADHRVVTSDNPRSEKPAAIIADIVRGIPVGAAFEIIEDRTAAIEYAVLNAKKDDLILLAGKGHEDYQDVMGTKYPFSDVAAAQAALAKRRQQQMLNG